MAKFLQKLGLDQETLEGIRPTSVNNTNKDKHKSNEHYFICNFNSINCINIIKSRAKYLPNGVYFKPSIPKIYQEKHKEFSKKVTWLKKCQDSSGVITRKAKIETSGPYLQLYNCEMINSSWSDWVLDDQFSPTQNPLL